MSEEQLKQLNTRLLEAEKLLEDSSDLIHACSENDEDEIQWHKKYHKYLKTYKK